MEELWRPTISMFSFVMPLKTRMILLSRWQKKLRRVGLKVWFDKFTLKVGDSLRDSIETGLFRSRYGVVIFSKHFLSKNWSKAELNGLFTREMEGHKVILPVWHKI